MKQDLIIYTDGGAKGNPGPAAVGVLIVNTIGLEIFRESKRIGNATNNTAEYLAVLEALDWVVKNFQEETKSIKFLLDSNLVVNQLNGKFKIKKGHLRDLSLKIKNLEKLLGIKITYNFIPREKNKIADFLVNQSFK